MRSSVRTKHQSSKGAPAVNTSHPVSVILPDARCQLIERAETKRRLQKRLLKLCASFPVHRRAGPVIRPVPLIPVATEVNHLYQGKYDR